MATFLAWFKEKLMPNKTAALLHLVQQLTAAQQGLVRENAALRAENTQLKGLDTVDVATVARALNEALAALPPATTDTPERASLTGTGATLP